MLQSPGARSPCLTSRKGLETPLIGRVPLLNREQPSVACSTSSDWESTATRGLRTRVPHRCRGQFSQQTTSQRSVLHCAAQKRDPPDAPKEEFQRRGGREWLQTLLSRFGPLTDKAPNRLVLDFEKPLVELDNRIKEVKIYCQQDFGRFGQHSQKIQTA